MHSENTGILGVEEGNRCGGLGGNKSDSCLAGVGSERLSGIWRRVLELRAGVWGRGRAGSASLQTHGI